MKRGVRGLGGKGWEREDMGKDERCDKICTQCDVGCREG